MLHRLHPRRHSGISEWVAIVLAAIAALFLVFYGPPAHGAGRAELSDTAARQ